MRGKILSGLCCGNNTEVFSVDSGGNVATAGALLTSVPNSSITGTTTAYLAKLTGSHAVTATTSDTTGILGVVLSGQGTSGNAQVAVEGQAICAFDGPTTAGDYVQTSSTTAGQCHDAGFAYPATGQVLGRVLATSSSAGTYGLYLFGAEQRASASGFSGSLVGDVTGTQSATAVVKVNGGAIPASATVLGTNSSGQFVAQIGVLSNNISGNAATVTNGAYTNVANSFTATQTITAGGTALTTSGGTTGISASGAENGVVGYATGPAGAGVYGDGSASGGTGVYGRSVDSNGTGLLGMAVASTGNTTGALGHVNSATGVAGVFRNAGGGKILSGTSGSGNTEVFSVDGSGNVTSVGAMMTLIPNNSGGTTNKLLAKLAGGQAVIANTSDTDGFLGIVVSGGGTTGNAQIAVAGQTNCTFDGATTAGDYVQASSTAGGACHDAGTTYPSAGQVLGGAFNKQRGRWNYDLFGAEQRTNPSEFFTAPMTITATGTMR